MPKKVLIIGSGGREHALAWKIMQSRDVGLMYAAPGNPGIEDMNIECLPEYKATDIPQLADFAEKNADFTVVGPEDPLALGIVYEFTRRQLPVFGPTQEAARLESSKIFAKEVMFQNGVPTALYRDFSNPDEADKYIEAEWDRTYGGEGVVVKADGLALGKGVYVCSTVEKARKAVDELMRQKVHKSAGERILIEKKLKGKEGSVIAISDGTNFRVFPAARDHKPAYDGNPPENPNTGGMGAITPVPDIVPATMDEIKMFALEPTLRAMNARGSPFKGALYWGGMLTDKGPMVLEYNARFGDPETQVLMMGMSEVDDLLKYLMASAAGGLSTLPEFRDSGRHAVGVVMASGGYPGDYKPNTGKLITGLKEVARAFPDGDVMVFHAGTKRGDDGKIYNSGGRVLCVTAYDDNLDSARAKAYRAVDMIKFDGAHFRKTIGLPQE
jgi:phosphoribosylamine--glycine ligase